MEKNNDLFILLDKAVTMPLDDYNPYYVIETVNALHALGKKNGLAKITYYLERCDNDKSVYGLFWILRVLFDMPEKQLFLPVRIGRPGIPSPTDQAKLPRFPIVIVDDIPFLCVTKFLLGGKADAVKKHITFFNDHGVFRKRPLKFPESMAGIKDKFRQRWKMAYGEGYTIEVMTIINKQIAMCKSYKNNIELARKQPITKPKSH